MILEGTTSSGAVVPVQVTSDGKVVAEGRTGPQGPEGPEGPQGPEGPAGAPGNLWSGSDPGHIYYTGGSVGIGTAIPSRILSIDSGASSNYVQLTNSSASSSGFELFFDGTNAGLLNRENGALAFDTNSLERARIDSSGRLLVGTSSSRANTLGTPRTQIESVGDNFDSSLGITSNSANGYGPSLVFGISSGTSNGSVAALTAAATGLGRIDFAGADGTSLLPGCRIEAFTDATPNANDMPGRLVFSTTAVGSSSPTERVRIDSQGDVIFQGAPIIKSPDGKHWAIEVDNNGNLSASLAI